MSWIFRLVKIADEGEGRATDIMEIDRPGDLRDIATQFGDPPWRQRVFINPLPGQPDRNPGITLPVRTSPPLPRALPSGSPRCIVY